MLSCVAWPAMDATRRHPPARRKAPPPSAPLACQPDNGRPAPESPDPIAQLLAQALLRDVAKYPLDSPTPENTLTGSLSTVYSHVMTGKDLRRIRKRLGLTQVQLAERIGVTANTIARQERGEVRISEPEARLLLLLAKGKVDS